MLRKVGMLCCSDGEREENRAAHKELCTLLECKGIRTVHSPFLYRKDGPAAGTPEQRAEILNSFFADREMGEIYDLSGGDMANEVLELLDYPAIAQSNAEFWGYSDLTTVINAIYTKTGKSSVLYQIKNLVGSCGEQQRADFFTPEHKKLFWLPTRFVQGERLRGTVVGGNIRCFLKLAGTGYFPDLNGKILFLEANSGREPQLRTYLSQLKQLEALKKIRGILLGTFTQMEREGMGERAVELVLESAGGNLPVARTLIGHGPNSRAIRIGGYYELSAETACTKGAVP